MAQLGRVSVGSELIREGLTRSQRTGARAIEPFSLGLLGEAYGASGKPESARTLTKTLLSSQSFTFNGHRYDFSTLVPGGVALHELFSNTGVPGVTGFPIWGSLWWRLSRRRG
jgi:hypothetical protein